MDFVRRVTLSFKGCATGFASAMGEFVFHEILASSVASSVICTGANGRINLPLALAKPVAPTSKASPVGIAPHRPGIASISPIPRFAVE